MNNLEEIKALMRFYLLMCKDDLSGYKYAAVDELMLPLIQVIIMFLHGQKMDG